MKKENSRQMKTGFKAELADLELYKIELELERRVIADIRKRQRAIPGLRQGDYGYTATWGKGGLTPGCKDCCLAGKWVQIRTTTKCNLNCVFCYYFGTKDRPGRELIPPGMYLVNGRLLEEPDIKLLFEVQGKQFLRGVAWLHFEPLLEIDKMLHLMQFIHKKGYHQWLYTNGILAKEGNLKKLADAGLDEIRFNLAATNCSGEVIKNMKTARRYFKYLCIESPMTVAFHESFMRKKEKILDTGVDHIHFAELQLFPGNRFKLKSEGTAYRYKKGYVSPIKSRQLTYDIFAAAQREGWKNVVLHDCSNETKFFRGINQEPIGGFGTIDYRGSLSLDNEFYRDAIRYLKRP